METWLKSDIPSKKGHILHFHHFCWDPKKLHHPSFTPLKKTVKVFPSFAATSPPGLRATSPGNAFRLGFQKNIQLTRRSKSLSGMITIGIYIYTWYEVWICICIVNICMKYMYQIHCMCMHIYIYYICKHIYTHLPNYFNQKDIRIQTNLENGVSGGEESCFPVGVSPQGGILPIGFRI